MKFLLFIVCLMYPMSQAFAVNCSLCKKKISGEYLLDAKKQAYCSKKCFSSLLPNCSVCKKKITGKYNKIGSQLACSQACINKLLPKCTLCKKASTKLFRISDQGFCETCNKRVKCFSCSMPFAKGVRHHDGRSFCTTCRKVAVFDQKIAERLYIKAQKEQIAIAGVKGRKIPPISLVGLTVMKKNHPMKNADAMTLRGYYQEVKKVSTTTQAGKVISKEEIKVKENIFLIDGVKQQDFLVTAVHELTHDWLSDYYPGIKVAPLWIEEGACQYMAYIFCLKKGYKDHALKISKAPDNVYGKGFRYYHKKFGNNNWVGALKWMKTKGYLKKPPIGSQRKHSH
jgi:hypothetical protein